MLLRSHPSVKSVLNLSFLLFQPQILMSSSTIMTSSGPASSLFNYSSISSSPEASIHTASSIVTQEVYFKENAARAPTDLFQSGLELLESAHAGILNERTSYLIRSLSEGITDERLKHFLFGTAMRNLSKVASQDKVDRIYLPVSKYRILPRTISNIIDSDAVTWSDGYIAALNSNKPSPQVKLEQSLTSCLEQVVESSAATPKWFESVDDARGRLTRLLRSSLRLVRSSSLLRCFSLQLFFLA